jgi:conjugal transfer pilus assembly protein TraW
MEMVRKNQEKEGRIYRILKIIVTSPITIVVIWICICIIISALLLSINAKAKDFGVVGRTSEIKEVDAIEEIKGKLSDMEARGELDEHNERMKKEVSDRIKSPKSLNLGRASEVREYKYDPSIEVKEDLRDARGIVFHRKGTKVNPLDVVSMPYELIFFDGEDEDQLKYVIKKYEESEIKPKLILTGGSPVKLEEEYKLDFYFDQEGEIIKKLGIKAVPAIVMQEDKVLKVKEVRLSK